VNNWELIYLILKWMLYLTLKMIALAALVMMFYILFNRIRVED